MTKEEEPKSGIEVRTRHWLGRRGKQKRRARQEGRVHSGTKMVEIPPPGLVETYRKTEPEIGRNDPCPCGSGKKYKRCCMRKKTQAEP